MAGNSPAGAPSLATPFGLIGRKLGHSWSRQIHEQLGSAPYSHLELEPGEVAGFLAEGRWRGLNAVSYTPLTLPTN